MSSNDGPSKPSIPAWKWVVVVLMLFATVINYMDRQALASVGSHIKKDFHLKEEGYGNLEAWFGYSYAVFLVVAGVLADRLEPPVALRGRAPRLVARRIRDRLRRDAAAAARSAASSSRGEAFTGRSPSGPSAGSCRANRKASRTASSTAA
jgi:hypothetical protein